MLDALELRGMAVRTHEAYIDAEARLGRRFGRNPALLTAAQVQGNLLHLLRDSHLARSSVNQYGCALQIVYGTVLAQPPEAFQIPLPRALQALPKVLARQALAQWFASACHFNARSFLMLADGSGLRVSEL